MKKVVVAGAGGFIGGHLTKALKETGHHVRAVDIKPLTKWYQITPDVDNLVLDLKTKENCYQALNGYEEVFNLAADMGGMGFIETHKADCMLSVLINTHLLMAARDLGTRRFFYASSACVYNGEKQTDPNNPGLKESDAYPALPEDGYGWEKLFSERMCRHFREDFGLVTRIARFHNVYGPFGTYDGGREKAPAAICRKVIEGELFGRKDIVIWGDDNHTRSDPGAPKGVRGRNSDNTLILTCLGWEPSIPVKAGLRKTYDWIKSQMLENKGKNPKKAVFNEF